jgi:hypothetical protein
LRDELKIIISSDSNPAENIADAILLLENLLRSKKKRAIMLLDEFQEIGEIAEAKGIEGAIRHAAQETRNLAIIFSGSNSHLLKSMFEDERRPLYKLCRKIILGRIAIEDYKQHLNKAAKLMWKGKLNEEAFVTIMSLTEQHPYYVNYLCDELWSNDTSPNEDKVNKAWLQIAEEEHSDLLKDFFSLSENQRKLLIHIANYGGKDVYSHESSQKMNLPISSISSGLATLIEKDYIEKTAENYRLIVPVYKIILRKS